MSCKCSSRSCQCISCVSCNCAEHTCAAKAARRAAADAARPRPSLHYTTEELTSVTAASFRAPTAQELRESATRAAKPEWSAINSPVSPNRAARFEGQSVTSSTYRGEQNPRPTAPAGAHRPFFDRSSEGADVLAPRPSLPFEGRSAYSEQYAPVDLAAARNARTVPKDRHLQPHFSCFARDAPLASETTNRREFRPYEIDPSQRQVHSPLPEQPRPSLPFEGESATKAAFKAYDVRRDAPVRVDKTKDVHRSHFERPTELWAGEGGRNTVGTYETETSQQYTNKTRPPCPAKQWETPLPTPQGGRTPLTY